MAGGTSDSSSSAAYKRCKKTNLTNAVKCENCANIFHYGCVKYYPNVKYNSSKPEGAKSDIFWDAVNVKMFHYIVQQKDELINQLRETISLLQEHIQLFKKSGDSDKLNSPQKTQKQIKSKSQLVTSPLQLKTKKKYQNNSM